MTANDHAIVGEKRDLRRGAMQILSGFGVRMIARILLITFVARIYGVADFGRLGETVAIIELLGAFATFGLSKTLLGRLGGEQEPGQAPPLRHIREAMALAGGISLVIVLILFVAWPYLTAPALSGSQFILLGIPLLAVTEVATTATRHFRTVIWDTLIKALVKPWSFLLLCVFAYYAIRGMELPSGHIVTSQQALLFAYVASLLLTAILAGVAMARAFRSEERSAASRPSMSGVIELARSSWPIALNDTGVFAFRRIDIIILAAVAGPEATGVYYLAQQIATIVEKIRYLYEPMLSPIVAQSQSLDTISEHLRRLGLFIFAVQMAIILLFVFFGEFVLGWFGVGFAAGILVVLIILFGELLDGSFGLCELPMVYRDPKWPPRLVLFTLVSEVLLVWILGEKFGALGAALGFAASMMALAVMRIIMVRKLYGFKVVGVGHLGLIAAVLTIMFAIGSFTPALDGLLAAIPQ